MMIEMSKFNDKSMSVAELISELQKVPNPDTTAVISEGCDCDGMVQEVVMDTWFDDIVVCLNREKKDGS